jgi:hypothetical protein
MIDIVQQLLENAEQHVRMCVVETERTRQTRLMIDVMWHAERCCVTRTEDQLQARHHMALWNLQYPLADPQVDQQVFECLNE